MSKRENVQTLNGKNNRLTYALGKQLCRLIATGEKSLPAILAEHPELPPIECWLRWRRKHSWLREAWRIARESQAEHLAQKCLDIATETVPTNAHAQRLKFDVYRQLAKWLHPLAFSERPQSSGNVNVAVAIGAETLSEIRSRLEATRAQLRDKPETATVTVPSSKQTKAVQSPSLRDSKTNQSPSLTPIPVTVSRT